MKYLINTFGRVVEVPDEDVAEHLKRGDFAEATDDDIAAYKVKRSMMNNAAGVAGSVYFQTVKASPDGYGMSRGHMVKQLQKQGVTLNENYVDQKVGLLYNYPYGIMSMRSPIRLVFTMFESDKLPEEWADYLAMADEVIVPSTWCQKVFAKSGIESTVVPLGYNDEVFKYIDRPVPSDTDGTFTFIHYDSFNVRKGFQEVFQAFTEEFTEKDNVRMILKTAQNSVAIPIMPDQYPNIEMVTGQLPENELQALLGRSNCMVYPSRGEGFGITPLEAMATGLPAIVPNEHGISQYFNKNVMLEVKANGRCPGLYTRFKGQDVGDMVVSDNKDLRKQMRYAYEHQRQMKTLGQNASEYVKNFTYAKSAEKLAVIIKKWEDAEITKRSDSKYLLLEEV